MWKEAPRPDGSARATWSAKDLKRERRRPTLAPPDRLDILGVAAVERNVLEREIADAHAQLAVYEQIRQQYPVMVRAQAFALLTLDYGLQSMQAHLAWVEAALTQLRNGQTLLSLSKR